MTENQSDKRRHYHSWIDALEHNLKKTHKVLKMVLIILTIEYISNLNTRIELHNSTNQAFR